MRRWFTSFTVFDTGCLPKESKRWVLGITVLLCLIVTGCDKREVLLTGPFSDTHLFLNTELDRKLRDQISTHLNCFDLHRHQDVLGKADIERYEKNLIQFFYELLPPGTSTKTVLNALQSSGAHCRTETSGEITITHCVLTKEYIHGKQDLYLLGWRIRNVFLTKNSFEYLITSQGDGILDVSANVIGGECYEIDKDLYEKSKTIKPIRRLQ